MSAKADNEGYLVVQHSAHFLKTSWKTKYVMLFKQFLVVYPDKNKALKNIDPLRIDLSAVECIKKNDSKKKSIVLKQRTTEILRLAHECEEEILLWYHCIKSMQSYWERKKERIFKKMPITIYLDDDRNFSVDVKYSVTVKELTNMPTFTQKMEELQYQDAILYYQDNEGNEKQLHADELPMLLMYGDKLASPGGSNSGKLFVKNVDPQMEEMKALVNVAKERAYQKQMDQRKKVVYDTINKTAKPLDEIIAESQQASLPIDFETVEEAYAYEKGEISGEKKVLPSGQPCFEIASPKKEAEYEFPGTETVVFPEENWDLVNLKPNIMHNQDILNSLLKVEKTPNHVVTEESLTAVANDTSSSKHSDVAAPSLHAEILESLNPSVEDIDHDFLDKFVDDKEVPQIDSENNNYDMEAEVSDKSKNNEFQINPLDIWETNRENESERSELISHIAACITTRDIAETESDEANDNVLNEKAEDEVNCDEAVGKKQDNKWNNVAIQMTQNNDASDGLTLISAVKIQGEEKNDPVCSMTSNEIQKNISTADFNVSLHNIRNDKEKTDFSRADIDLEYDEPGEEEINHNEINNSSNRVTVYEISCEESTDQEIKQEFEIRAGKSNENSLADKSAISKKAGRIFRCKLCNSMSESTKPLQIINVGDFEKYVKASDVDDDVYNTPNDTYICLSGTHLKYVNSNWEPADNCKLSREFDVDSLDEALAGECYKRYEIENNITCMFIPPSRKRRSKWLVKQGPVLYTHSVTSRSMSDFKFIEESFDQNPVLEDSDHVEQNLEASLDNGADTSDGKKLPTMNEITLPFKTILNNVNTTTKNITNNFAKKFAPFGNNQIIDYHGKLDQKLELESFKRVYITPLHQTISQLSKFFENKTRHCQELVADDSKNPSIGWFIRNNLCTCFANLINIGLISDSKLSTLFGKVKPLSVWYIVKDFTHTFDSEDFRYEKDIFKSIDDCSYLPSDDMKFRYYICDLLNRSREQKVQLLVLWFHQFVLNKDKLKRYYEPNSFWRFKDNYEFDEFYNENIIAPLKQLQKWPFKLHLNFEYKYHNKEGHLDHDVDQEFIYSFE